MAFAERTKVSVVQTRNEIEAILSRYGATRFAYFTEANRAIIIFEAVDRRIKFELPLADCNEQQLRSRWRSLLLCIKAKLESVAANIETFEEAFLAHVVMPDGRTVGQHTLPMIEQTYNGGKMLPLLPSPTSF